MSSIQAFWQSYNIIQGKYLTLLADAELAQVYEKTLKEYEKKIFDLEHELLISSLPSENLFDGMKLEQQINLLEEEKKELQKRISESVSLLEYSALEKDLNRLEEFTNSYRIENNFLQNQYNSLLELIAQKLNIDILNDYTDSTLIGDKIDIIQNTIKTYQQQIQYLNSTIDTLEKTVDDNIKHLRNIFETLNSKMFTELENLDTELIMYHDNENINSLQISDLVPVYKYELTNSVNREYMPFLKFLSERINNDISDNINDFDDAHEDILMYHAYIILCLRLFDIFSQKYIRNYIDYVYSECKRAQKEQNTSIELPKLILPQTFQTNSLYYLMNRYNSKAYQPDRVLDFGNYIYGLLRPEFRPDTTQALNLFQPGISKRYNSILIYSDETMKILQQLRDTLASLLQQ